MLSLLPRMLGCGPYQSCGGIGGLGIPFFICADVADAGLWSPSSCGGTDGLGNIDVVSDSIDDRAVAPASGGSADGFSIPDSVDAVADAVLWSPLCCGCDDAMGCA